MKGTDGGTVGGTVGAFRCAPRECALKDVVRTSIPPPSTVREPVLGLEATRLRPTRRSAPIVVRPPATLALVITAENKSLDFHGFAAHCLQCP